MKKIVLLLFIALFSYARDPDFVESESEMLLRVKDHIHDLIAHLSRMDQYFDAIENNKIKGNSYDELLQRLANARNRFNWAICLPGYKKRLAFYSYHSHQKDNAFSDLKRHYSIVKTHLDTMQAVLDDVDTSHGMDGHWQDVRILNKWYQDFSVRQCNAVGFSYIPPYLE